MSPVTDIWRHGPTPVKLAVLGFGLATFYLFHLALSGSAAGAYVPARAMQPRGTIMHIVLFQFKPTTAPSAMAEVAAAFQTLKHRCRKANGRPYILGIDGGTNISQEKAGKGYDHAYVVTFANVADRDFYVQDDVAHRAFKASLGDLVQDVLVFDFESGQFQRQVDGGIPGGRWGRAGKKSGEEMNVRSV